MDEDAGRFLDEPERLLYALYVVAFNSDEEGRRLWMLEHTAALDALIDWIGVGRTEQVRQLAMADAKKPDERGDRGEHND
jgi:hypothetical protein